MVLLVLNDEKKLGHAPFSKKEPPYWSRDQSAMDLYQKLFVQICIVDVPSFMILSSKAHSFHLSAALLLV